MLDPVPKRGSGPQGKLVCVCLRGFSLSPLDCADATSLSTLGERHTGSSSAVNAQHKNFVRMYMCERMLMSCCFLGGFFGLCIELGSR